MRLKRSYAVRISQAAAILVKDMAKHYEKACRKACPNRKQRSSYCNRSPSGAFRMKTPRLSEDPRLVGMELHRGPLVGLQRTQRNGGANKAFLTSCSLAFLATPSTS